MRKVENKIDTIRRKKNVIFEPKKWGKKAIWLKNPREKRERWESTILILNN